MTLDECSASELSQLLGITPRTVDRLANAAPPVFTRVRHGVFVTSASIQGYLRYKLERLERRLGAVESSYERARTEKLQEEATLARLTREEREGSVIPTKEARILLTGIAQMIRTAFLAAPRKLAPRVADRSAAECEAVIKAEIYSILTRLASATITGTAGTSSSASTGNGGTQAAAG